MILQLDPPIPVFVVEGWGGPGGEADCFAWVDYSQEHFTLWKVAMRVGGAVFDVPQSHVRAQFNISMGRLKAGVTSPL
jgi:hypothetical protein